MILPNELDLNALEMTSTGHSMLKYFFQIINITIYTSMMEYYVKDEIYYAIVAKSKKDLEKITG